jgi:hypothetical protein
VSPLPRLEQISEFLALAITLRALGFDFVARLLIMSQRQLMGDSRENKIKANRNKI